MESKGVINIIELVAVVITLFVSFAIFFPDTDYKNKWGDAYTVLKARDTTVLLERTGDLHSYAFDDSMIDGYFSILFPEENVILWSETDGTIKSDVRVACVCSDSVIHDLYERASSVKLNERNINISYCKADLDSPSPCITNSDALVIYGYVNLVPYSQLISEYISSGNGIVEFVDFDVESQVDSVQSGTFGLKWVGSSSNKMSSTIFNNPSSSSQVTHSIHKYFYHIPMPFITDRSGESIDGCSYNPVSGGAIALRGVNYTFWICDNDSVWFDTNGDGTRDELVEEMGGFSLGGYNFFLNYVEGETVMMASFRPDYVFDGFLSFMSGGTWKSPHIEPVNGDDSRILLKSLYPSAIVDQIAGSRIAWAPTLDVWKDDERALATSLILWASNHEETSEVSGLNVGYLTSYINVESRDMMEIYKFSLGLGYPY